MPVRPPLRGVRPARTKGDEPPGEITGKDEPHQEDDKYPCVKGSYQTDREDGDCEELKSEGYGERGMCQDAPPSQEFLVRILAEDPPEDPGAAHPGGEGDDDEYEKINHEQCGSEERQFFPYNCL